MSRTIPPIPQKLVTVLALRDFMTAPGKPATAGQEIAVTPSVANTAIACGNARLPTVEDILSRDDDVHVENRDPMASHRDPKPRRR